MFTKWGFQATDTLPGAYDSQTRGFAVGGRLAIRSKSDVIQPVSLKAPSFKSGCGGLDIFGGSFSWINAEQFVSNLRAIGQNALGYAFSLGLEWVCPTCSAQLNKLQHYMNQINKMSADSCQAAKVAVNTAAGAMGAWQLQDCQDQNGEAGDKVQGWLSCAAGSEDQIRANIRENSWMTMLPEQSGWNPTARPNASQAGQDVTSQAMKNQGLSDEDRLLILSYIGTIAMVPDNNNDLQCQYVAPTLEFKDLIGGGPVKLRSCTSGTLGDSCTAYGETETTIEGYSTKVENLLRQVYTKVLTKTGSERKLTDDEKTFINRVNMPPVYTLIDTLAGLGGSGYSSTAESVMAIYSDLMAVEYAWSTVDMYMQVVEKGMINVSTICVSQDKEFKSNLRDIRTKRKDDMERIFKNLSAQAEATGFIAQIKSQLAQKARSNMVGLF